MSDKKIKYFVFYQAKHQGSKVVGRCEYLKATPVGGMDDIDNIEKTLMKSNGYTDLIIQFWQRFEDA